MVAYIQPSVMLLFIFVYVNFGQKVQYFIYTHINELKIMSLYMPTQNSLWHARIGIFNLNKIYIQKIKVPRLPLTNCHFSVTFFQFLFFFIKLFSRLKLRKLLLLVHYILVMWSFNLHHFLLLQSRPQSNLQGWTFAIGISIVLPLMIYLR